MLELPTILALSGMLALASAQSPGDMANSVCYPSGQVNMAIPPPCPDIKRSKDDCNEKYTIGTNPSPANLTGLRDCLCNDKHIIQVEKGCTSCKWKHAFLSKRQRKYFDDILDDLNKNYCNGPPPTEKYDDAWTSAVSLAGDMPIDGDGPDDQLINHAKDLPADQKTRVQFYWNGTTAEPSSTSAAATPVSLSASATPTASEEDDECVDEVTASQGSTATATPGSLFVTSIPDTFIFASAVKAPGSVQPTARPAQPNQSVWTHQNQTGSTEQVKVRVAQKCKCVKSGSDYVLACAKEMEVEGTETKVSAKESKELCVVPGDLPKLPASEDERNKITVPVSVIEQVCKCSYSPGSQTPASGSGSGSNGSGSSGAGGSTTNGAGSAPGSPGAGGSNTNGAGSAPGSTGAGGPETKGSGSAPGTSGSSSGPGSTGAGGSTTNGAGSAPGAGGPETKGSGSAPGSTGAGGPETNGAGSAPGTSGSSSGPGSTGAEGSNTNGSGSGSVPGSKGADSPKGVSPPGSLASNSPGIGSKTNGTGQHPIVSSASGNMPASMALFLAAMAILI